MSEAKNCPCGSKLSYQRCCRRLHTGTAASNAEELMRSRYSAYALCLADYIIRTTHPENESFQQNKAAWRKSLLKFSQQTRFEGLQIDEFVDGELNASVTFRAFLKQGGQDIGFSEKSCFEKVAGKWLYKSGLTRPLPNPSAF
ncbi:MAG: hypothetical protein K2X27_18005 [Candidatus Obscuribacterales bacterium]|nr:hypothetical protein [Candidatus Obscuribacterales bacterium]